MAVVSCSCSRVSSPSAFPSGGQSHMAMHHGHYGHQSGHGGSSLVHLPAEGFCPPLCPSNSSSSCLNLHSADDSFFLFALLLGEARFRCGFTLVLLQAEEMCRLSPGGLSRQENLQLPFPKTWLETCVGTRRFLPCGAVGGLLTLGAEDGWAQPPAILRFPRGGGSLFPAG